LNVITWTPALPSARPQPLLKIVKLAALELGREMTEAHVAPSR
jgi:hypothetical protein